MPKIIFQSHVIKSVANRIIQAARLILGPSNVCIFRQQTCQNYARAVFAHHPWYIAIPKIILRILACNPLGGLWLHLKWRWWVYRSRN